MQSRTSVLAIASGIASLLLLSLPPLAYGQGFDDMFVASVGDFNGDGLQDLYVHQRPRIVPIPLDDLTIPIALRAPVEPFILQQQSGGAFTVVSQLTAQQRSTAASWPRAQSLRLLASDFNVDGFRDLIVKGVMGSAIGGRDVLVFADSVTGQTASGSRSLDAEFTSYIQDTYRWIQKHNYFEYAAFENDWYHVENGPLITTWWEVDYLHFWGYTPPDDIPFLQDPDDAYDENMIPHGCDTLLCDYDVQLGVWLVFGTARNHTIVFDDFNTHFNDDAVSFARTQHASLRVLVSITAAKLGLPTIGGGELALVPPDAVHPDELPPTQQYMDDLMLRVLYHNVYCAIFETCGPGTLGVQPRVDFFVDRLGASSYFSGTCQTNINYTHGTYEVVGQQPSVHLTGYTLERGGPDSTTRARNQDKCTNKPKRVPEGVYTFTITSSVRWPNVPELETAHINRSDILIHSAAGAQGSIGCILVSKQSGANGTFAGGKVYSDQALNEIRTALGYTNQFKYNYGYVNIRSNGN